MSTALTSFANSLNWTILGAWGTKFGALAIFFILARILSPVEFGTVAIAIVVVGLFQNMFASSFGNAIVRHEKFSKTYFNTAFWLLLGFACALAIGIYLGAGLAETYLKIDDVKKVFQASSLIVVLHGLAFVQYGYVLRTMNFRMLAMRNLVAVIGGGIVGIIAALMGLGWWALILQQGVAAALNAIMLWFASDWRPGLRVSLTDARECLGFSQWMVLWALLNFFERQLDILIVGSLIGTAAAGYYSTGQRLTLILFELITGVVGQLFLPVFSRLQNKREELAGVFSKLVPALAMLLFPACVGLACIAPEAVRVLLGEKWLPAIPIVVFLSFYVGILGICFLNFQLMTALNKPSWIVAWTSPLIVSNVVLMIPAAEYGITAIAAVLLFRTAVIMPLTIFSVKALIPISIISLLAALRPTAFACLTMAAAIYGAKAALVNEMPAVLALATLLALGCTVYFGVLRIVFPNFLTQNIDYLRGLNRRM